MTLFLISRDNLAALKKALRVGLPGLGSSHLSEATAAGFGMRTHAALLASIAEEQVPSLRRLDPVLIGKRLTELGYEAPDLNAIAASLSTKKFPDRIVAEVRNGDRAAKDAWFYECRRRNIPMVSILARRKYVELEWDCITIDPRLDDHVQDEAGTRLVRTMYDRFCIAATGAMGKPFFNGKSFTGSIDRLSLPLARTLAEEFFGMLYAPMYAGGARS